MWGQAPYAAIASMANKRKKQQETSKRYAATPSAGDTPATPPTKTEIIHEKRGKGIHDKKRKKAAKAAFFSHQNAD